MIIKALVAPTPKRIKKFIKDKITKERVTLYSLIGAGIAIVSLNDVPIKGVAIGTLIYYGIAYEVIINSEEIINDPLFAEAYRNNFYANTWVPIRMF